MWMTSKDLVSQSFKLRQAPSKSRWNQPASTLHNLILTVPNSSCMYEYCDLPDQGITREREFNAEKIWHEVIRRSLSHPDELLIVDSRGRTPVQAACASKAPINVVRILLTSGKKSDDEHSIQSILLRTDNHGRTALVLAIANHASLAVVQYLLNRCPKASEIRDNAENLPLHVACMGDFDNDRNLIVQSLVKFYRRGAGEFSRSGKTPLHLAIECGGSLDVIRTLVDAHPASLTVKSCGESPLTAAIKSYSEPNVIECLVQGEPSVLEQVDGNGLTPLHHAIAYRSSVSVVDVLSKSTACISASNKQGDTPVHMAIKDRIRPYDIVAMLVQKSHSVVNCRNKAGDDPLDLVYKRLLKHLRQSRNDVNEASLWKTLTVLLKSRVYGALSKQSLVEEEGNNVFHMMVQTNVPFQIAEKALIRFPTSIQKLDSKQCLPIFHIVGSDASDRDEIATMMLEQYPGSTKVKDGIDDLLLTKAAHFSKVSPKLLKDIIAANPDALAVAGLKDGLFPFMLAATPKPILSRLDHTFEKQFVEWGFIESQGLQQQLDSIYTLLREGPHLISPIF